LAHTLFFSTNVAVCMIREAFTMAAFQAAIMARMKEEETKFTDDTLCYGGVLAIFPDADWKSSLCASLQMMMMMKLKSITRNKCT
jgi:hypothetical protein